MATGSSEEYLASLGFDTSDVDKAVNQTVTLLGHLGNQFDSVSGKAERAATNLSKSSKSTTTATVAGTRAQADRDRQLETSVRQTGLYNQGLNAQDRALTQVTGSLIAQRYALYDVATTYTTISAALIAADVYALKLAGDYQRAFTDVERTTEGSTAALGDLRSALVDLSTQGPITFAELSRIATLGNQLGVNSSGIEEFTKVVSQFATATGITADATAQAFGRLGNVLGVSSDEYGNLASSIVYVGRTSAATEQQIISLTERLGATARRAGLTADEVVGLSGALASFAVAPERAQGVFETYFNKLNSAVAEGGESLENFATVAGTTSERVSAMVRGGQGLDLLLSILRRLENAGTVETTAALESLGLTGLRVNEVLPRLAGGVDQLEQSLANSAAAWRENAELQRQYELITDDLNSRFMELVNSVNALIEAASGGQAQGLADLLKGLIDATNAAREFVSTPLGQTISGIVISVTLLSGVMLALAAANAVATASAYALITAQNAIGASGGLSGVRLLIGAMLGYTTTVNGATVSTLTFGGAMRTVLGPLALLLAGIQITSSELQDYGAIAEEVGRVSRENLGDDLGGLDTKGVGVDIETVTQALINAVSPLIQVNQQLGVLQKLLSGNIVGAFKQSGNQAFLGQFIEGGKSLAAFAPKASNAASASELADAKVAKLVGSFTDLSNASTAAGSGVGGAGRQIRTLVDYASDLSSVFNRAFEIRFGGQQAFDQISSGWQAVRTSIAQVNDEIARYQAEMLQLTADRAVREYWLSVAENYGDALRAGELRAQLAKIDTDLAASSRNLSEAQAKGSKTLVGNSSAAVENRSEILGLASSYQEYITALAAAGTPQAQLQSISAQLRQDFISQATQLGYNTAELDLYAAAFDDVSTAIARVPRDITVTANTDPALQALNEFIAQAQSSVGGGISVPIRTSNASLIASLDAQIQAAIAGMNRAGYSTAAAEYIAALSRAKNSAISAGYRSGTGWTGSGNPWEVAGVVHNRERVLNETGSRMVSSQFVNAANQGRNPWQFAPQAQTAMKMPSSIVVELSPVDRDLLAQGANVTVVLSGESLAESTSSYTADDDRRGGS